MRRADYKFEQLNYGIRSKSKNDFTNIKALSNLSITVIKIIYEIGFYINHFSLGCIFLIPKQNNLITGLDPKAKMTSPTLKHYLT
jgi:hypothetical protein